MTVRRRFAGRGLVCRGLAVALVASVLASPAVAAAQEDGGTPWDPEYQTVESVPSGPTSFRSLPDDPAAVTAGADDRVDLPSSVVAEVTLDPDAAVSVEGAPIEVAVPESNVIPVPDGEAGRGERGEVEAPAGEEGAGEPVEPVESVQVTVASEEDRAELGASAMVFDVRRSDLGVESAPVSVSVDYQDFAGTFGGGFANRLVVRRYPACVLSTPEVEACWQSELVEINNDAESKTVSLEVEAAPSVEALLQARATADDGEPADAPDDPTDQEDSTDVEGTTNTSTSTSTTEATGSVPEGGSSSASTSTVPDGSTTTTSQLAGEQLPAADQETEDGGTSETDEAEKSPLAGLEELSEAELQEVASLSEGFVYAMSSGPSGTDGNYAATPLTASMGWKAGGSAGNASYSVPIEVPQATAGPTPELSLNYSSQAVDGMTPDANQQGGELGLGWDMSGLGYVERRYVSCGMEAPVWIGGDLCWMEHNAVLVLNGVATELVRDTTLGEWRAKNDEGWRITRTTDSGDPNGDNDAERWTVQTPDGMKYIFGVGTTADGVVTNSTWTVPVFAKNSGEPCYNSNPDLSHCRQAWRWNLAEVIDPNGLRMFVSWHKETNHYARRMTPSWVSQYDRGGYPAQVRYSKRPFGGTAPTSVTFNYADRCIAAMGGGSCPAMTTANASQFPDVPVDQICTSSTFCADKYSPSFFITKRMNSISTFTHDGTTFRQPDLYSFTQSLPDPDGASNPSKPKLWLSKVQRFGQPASPFIGQTGASEVAMAPVDFISIAKENRAEALGPTPVMSVSSKMYRVAVISTETGGQIWFDYGQAGRECTHQDNPSYTSWHTNTQYCYPVHYSPTGAPAGFAIMNRWIVERVTLADALTTEPLNETNYVYTAPAWAYNDSRFTKSSHRTWSDYRGHEKVTEDSNNGTNVYQFYRGMHGDRLPGGGTRSVSITDTQGSTLDHEYLAGQLREDRQLDNGGVGRFAALHTYSAPITATDGTDNAHLVRETITKSRTNQSPATVVVTTTSTFNKYGLPTKVLNDAGTATTADDRCTGYTYANPTGGAYRWDRVAKEIFDGNCVGQYDRMATNTYDDNGNLTETRQYYGTPLTDATTTNRETTYTYDDVGRQITVETPGGRETKTTYAPPLNGLTTTVTTRGPGPFNYTSTTTLDLFRGLPAAVTDLNGHVTTSSYDGLGRLLKVFTPQDGSLPSHESVYYVPVLKNRESRIQTLKRTDGTNRVESWEHFDGFARLRETQTKAPNATGSAGTGRIVVANRFDKYGRQIATSDPFHNTSNPGTGLVNPGPGYAPNDTVTALDEFNRVVSVTQRRYSVSKAVSSTTYNGLESLTLSPEGRKTRTTSDAVGNVVKIERLDAVENTYSTTSYTYDRSDQLRSIYSGGDTTTYVYNALGQRTQSIDPDAGMTTYTYGLDDEIISTTDATGATILNSYDELGRLVARYDGSTTADPLLVYRAYWTAADTPSNLKGLVKGIWSFDGSDNHLVTFDAYDSMERPTVTTESISASGGPGIAGNYTTTQTYNAASQPIVTSLPAVADLPAETISRSYTDLGLPAVTTGQIVGEPDVTYLAGSVYRSDGKVTGRNIGSGSSSIQRIYSYDDLNRPERVGASGNAGTIKYVDDYHEYDRDGNLREIEDAISGQTQCYNYDDQSRLVAAWTSDTCDGWDPLTADTAFGPTPYRQEFSYDEKDRIISVSSGVTTPAVRSYFYAETGNAGPHAVTDVTDGTRAENLTYNERGDVVSRSDLADVTTLTWNSRGRLKSVQDGATTTASAYSHTGERFLRRDTDASGIATIASLSGHEIVRSPSGSVSAKRYYDSAVRTSVGLQWLLTDRQGSAHVAVDSADITSYSIQRYLPFGDVRGGDVLPTERNYLNRVREPKSGYLLMGARHYDSDLGVFLSVDPIVDSETPSSMNGYSYGANNPTSYSDSNGLFAFNIFSWYTKIAKMVRRIQAVRYHIPDSYRNKVKPLGNYYREFYKVQDKMPGGSRRALAWEVKNQMRLTVKPDGAGHYKKVLDFNKNLQGMLDKGLLSDVDRKLVAAEIERNRLVLEYVDDLSRKKGFGSPEKMLRSFPTQVPEGVDADGKIVERREASRPSSNANPETRRGSPKPPPLPPGPRGGSGPVIMIPYEILEPYIPCDGPRYICEPDA